MADVERDQYNSVAAIYDSIDELPQLVMSHELVDIALGDCTGKTVLDLGGGTGLEAMRAIEHGAPRVDVVDISPGMMDIGAGKAAKAGMQDKIRWIVGDISEPLDKLSLESAYDLVMVNWTFDHAETFEQLEAMWRNTANYTRSGGTVISVRMANPYAEAGKLGKYGVSFADFKEIPGGLQYTYNAHLEQQMTVPATTMSASLDYEQSKTMAERYGFVDFTKVPETDTPAYKSDPDFWQMHVDDLTFICITATKKS